MGGGMVESRGRAAQGADGHKATVLRGHEQARDRERRPFTFGLFSRRTNPGTWRTTFDIVERTCRQGGRMFAQVHSRALNVLLFETQLPFDKWEVWRDLRKLPLAEQKQWLLDADKRRRWSRSRPRRTKGPRSEAPRRARRNGTGSSHDRHEGPAQVDADLARQRNTQSGRADDRHGARSAT